MRRRFLASLLALVVLSGVAPSSARAEYPDRSRRITFIVPFSAGGSNDILARVIGQKLSEAWQIPVVIENQVGASGAIGTLRAAKAPPDGYTLLILSSTYTINAAVMPQLPYDPKTSFAPVAMLGEAPMMLAASKTVPAHNARELIALARARPGSLTYGSAGVGSVNHVAMELLKSLGSLQIEHAPYRTGNSAVNDLIGGHIDMFIGSLPQMMQLAQSDGATAIAVTGAQRAPSVPDVPTIAESGVPGYELEQWWGLVVPTGTPRDVIDRLNAEVNRILATPEVAAFMQREGAKPTPATPEALGQHLSAELQRWSALAARVGLKVQ